MSLRYPLSLQKITKQKVAVTHRMVAIDLKAAHSTVVVAVRLLSFYTINAGWSMLEALYHGDIALFTRINQEWTARWLDLLLQLFSSVPLLWALLVVTVTILVRRCWRKCHKPIERQFRLKKILVACLLLACSVALTEGTTYTIKYYSNRQRPYHALGGARYTDGAEWIRRPVDAPSRDKRGSSFVSGHASNSMAFAVTMGYLCPPLKPFIYALPACVGYSRIYLGRHYPSDVIGGWILGWLLSSCVCRVFRARIPPLAARRVLKTPTCQKRVIAHNRSIYS